MNRKMLPLFAVIVAAFILCPAASGVATHAPVPLFTFCGMEAWAEAAARQPPTRLCVQINECEYAHEPIWVEDCVIIGAVLSALGEIRVTSTLPDYGVATGTDTCYAFTGADGDEVEIMFQNGMLYVDPYEREGRLYPASGMETLNALTELLEQGYLGAGEMGAGQLTFSLSETPSTGYLWSLRIEDPDVLTLTEEGFIRASDSDMPGGDGGSRTYTFAAVKPGTSEVVFRLISHHDEVVETRRFILAADEDLRLREVEQMPGPSGGTEPEDAPDQSGPLDAQAERDRNVVVDGQRVTLVLDENPTTGYLWSVRIGNPGVVALDDEEYAPDDPFGTMDGGGGQHSYIFSAKAKGVTAVYFDLISHQDEITQKTEYLITVDEALRVTEAKLNNPR